MDNLLPIHRLVFLSSFSSEIVILQSLSMPFLSCPVAKIKINVYCTDTNPIMCGGENGGVESALDFGDYDEKL